MSEIDTMYNCPQCKRDMCNFCAAAIHISRRIDEQDGFESIEDLQTDSYHLKQFALIERVKLNAHRCVLCIIWSSCLGLRENETIKYVPCASISVGLGAFLCLLL